MKTQFYGSVSYRVLTLYVTIKFIIVIIKTMEQISKTLKYDMEALPSLFDEFDTRNQLMPMQTSIDFDIP